METGLVARVVPPAPWRLRGWGMQTIGLVDVAIARRVTPPRLRIIEVLPGKTLASFYFGAYGADSTLAYRELIVATALVLYRRRLGFWIPKLYVDDERSLRGGREIWSLPKELATFAMQDASGAPLVIVEQSGREICRFRHLPTTSAVPIRAPLPAFGISGQHVSFFTGRLRATVALAKFQLEVESGSYLEPFGFERPLFALAYTSLDVTVPEPHEIPPFASSP